MDTVIILSLIGLGIYMISTYRVRGQKKVGRNLTQCPECSKEIEFLKEGQSCPFCGALIAVKTTVHNLEEMSYMERRILVWFKERNISRQRCAKLLAFVEGDRKKLLDDTQGHLLNVPDGHEEIIETKLMELRFIEERLSTWRKEKRVSPVQLERLADLCSKEKEELIGRLKERETAIPAVEERAISPEPAKTHEVSALPAEEFITGAQEKEKLPDVSTPNSIPEAIPVLPRTKPVAVVQAPREKESNGEKFSDFLSENSIKLMLYVGIALFVLGASIFVKNYWDIIPGTLKFASLLFITFATYFAGYLLRKSGKIPRTSVALMVLGSLLIPYNFFAVNNFALLGTTYDWRIIWLIASFVCLPLYLFNSWYLPSLPFFYSSLGIYTVIVYLFLSLKNVPVLFWPAVFIIFCSLLPLALVVFSQNILLRRHTLRFTAVVGGLMFIRLALYWAGPVFSNHYVSGIVGVEYLLLCLYYVAAGVIGRRPKMMYAASITFYCAVIVLALSYNPGILMVIAIMNSIALLLDLALRKIFFNDEYADRVHFVNYALFMATAMGIFILELGKFAAQYNEVDFSFPLLQVTNNYQIIWISLIGMIYLAVVQMQKRTSDYIIMFAGYSYIVVFSVMQLFIPDSYHAFGFMITGMAALVLDARHSFIDDEKRHPLKYFSYLFTLVMTIYLAVKYVMVGNYALTSLRTGGLIAYFGLALYLYRERGIFYVLSGIYYWGVLVTFTQLLGFPHYSLIITSATLPFWGLYLWLRKNVYARHLLNVQTAMFGASFIISMINSYYLPSSASGTVTTIYYSNLLSLALLFLTSTAYVYVLRKPIFGICAAGLFYLTIFCAAYPYWPLDHVSMIISAACFIPFIISLKIRRENKTLATSIDAVTHPVQAMITLFCVSQLFQSASTPEFVFAIAAIGFQSLYYSIAAINTIPSFNYIGGLLGYLALFMLGYHFQVDISSYGLLFTAMTILQAALSRFTKEAVRESSFRLSLLGAGAIGVIAAQGIFSASPLDLRAYMLIASILIGYFSLFTWYKKDAAFEYPATLFYFLLVYGAARFLGFQAASQFLLLTVASFSALAVAHFLKRIRNELFAPLFLLAQANVLVVLSIMLLSVYYFRVLSPDTLLWTVLLQVVFFALNAYFQKNSNYIYPSGLLFYLLVWIVFPRLQLPSTHLGVVLLPLAGIYTLVTYLTKKRQKSSADAFHILSLTAVGIVLVTLFFNWAYFIDYGFSLSSLLLLVIAFIFVASGLIYGKNAYSYAGILILIILLFTCGMHWHFVVHQYNFLLMLFAGAAFLGAKLAERRRGKDDRVVVRPFVNAASFFLVATFMVSVVRFFVYDIMSQGALVPAETNVALFITFIVTVVYGTLSYLNRDERYTYFSLGSFFILYLLLLVKLQIPLTCISLVSIAPLLCLGDVILEIRKQSKFSLPFYIFTNAGVMGSLLWALNVNAQSVTIVSGIGAFVYLAMVFYRPTEYHSILFQLLAAVSWITLTNYSLPWGEYLAFHLMVLSVLFAVCGNVFHGVSSDIKPKPFYVASGIAMVMSLIFSLEHISYSYIIFSLSAAILFAVGTLSRLKPLQQTAYVIFLGAYELFIYQLQITTVEFYSVPPGMFLFFWGTRLERENAVREVLLEAGTSVIYLPCLVLSFHDTWSFHGIFLGIIALIIFLGGIKLRSRYVIAVSAFVLILNGVIQSYNYARTIPRWVYLASGGTLLITLGMIFELKREKLQQVRKDLIEKWRCFK